MDEIYKGRDSNGIYYEYNLTQYNDPLNNNQASARIFINGIEYFGLYTLYYNSPIIYMFSHIDSLSSKPLWKEGDQYFHYIFQIYNTTRLYNSSNATTDMAMLWEENNYFAAYHLSKTNPIILKKVSSGSAHGDYSYWMRLNDAPTLKNTVKIYKNNEWKYSMPYIYKQGQWKEAIVWIYKNNQWKKVGFNESVPAPIPATAAYSIDNTLITDSQNNILVFNEGG